MIVEFPEQLIKVVMRDESLSDTENDRPRLGQLVLVYGGSHWSSDWITGVKFPKKKKKLY